MMLGCPSWAALKTGVRPHCRRHSTQTTTRGRVVGSAQRTCHHRSSALTMAAVVQGKVKDYSVSTPTLPTGCFTPWISPTSASFTCTTCHMRALSSDNTQHTMHRQCTLQDTWGYTYRPSTHSPRHEQWNPACTCRWQAVPHQHVLLELRRAACWIHSRQFHGAMTPSLWLGAWWFLHGHRLQHGAEHSALAIKMERITSEHKKRNNNPVMHALRG